MDRRLLWGVMLGAGVFGGLILAAWPRRRPACVYNPRWRETFRLEDGTWIAMRLIRPSDKAILERALRTASAQTVYQRFLTVKKRFTPSELRYLTELDNENRLAIGAARIGGSTFEGAGIARLTRDPIDPTRAEIAIAVADHMQRRGLGIRLFERLAQAALERGIRTFDCTILATNDASIRFFTRLDPQAKVIGAGNLVTMRVDLVRNLV
ncbi:MAG: GNAT family N-acetyltransferase [Fimbriimonadaceae bacterium]|nr:GNAT family N-acetyltransferase [Fimbriimonadaceae bacterium]